MKQFLLLVTMVTCSFTVISQTPQSIQKDTTFKLLNRQPKFFVSVHSGYAVGLGSTFKFYPDDITSIAVEQVNNQTPTETVNYKSTTKGLGDGFRYGAGLSYILNDYINVGFEFDYFRSTISRSRDSSFHNSGTTEYKYNQHSEITYDATLLTLSPTITFKAISRPKFYIYNKIGAVLTYRPNSIQKNTVVETRQFNGEPSSNSTTDAYTRYEWGIKKPALGFMASVGAQLKLSEKVRAFSEIQFSHIVFAVRNRVLTDYSINGASLINTLSESEKVIEFKNDFSTTQQTSNPNQPTVSVVQRIPITYIGLQVGFAYRF